MIESVLKEGIQEHIMKKSRFIGYARHVENKDQAEAYIERVKALHPQATHHVSAYRIKEGELVKYDDDGEPSQTAGRPILDFILRRDLTDLCIVVVRYFGGILLGKGGLVKAYTLAAQEAVEAAGIVPYKKVYFLKLSFDYTAQGALEYQLKEKNMQVIQRAYGEKVTLDLLVDRERMGEIKDLVASYTSGRGDLEIVKEDRLPFVRGNFQIKDREEEK